VRACLSTEERYDHPETLHYVDPPYVATTRRRLDHRYEHELSDEDHVALAEALHGAPKASIFKRRCWAGRLATPQTERNKMGEWQWQHHRDRWMRRIEAEKQRREHCESAIHHALDMIEDQNATVETVRLFLLESIKHDYATVDPKGET